MKDLKKNKNLLENIPKRVPVLDTESLLGYNIRDIDKQWLLITESIRRKLLADAEIRSLVLGFSNASVGEDLPRKFLDKLSSDNSIHKLISKFSNQILSYVSLNAVEDEQIKPDITYAPRLQTPEEIIRRLSLFFDIDSQEFQTALDKYVQDGTFQEGITNAERVMIAQRYRFARDVKMLALMTEIFDSQDLINNSGDHVTLPSGIEIYCDIEDPVKKQEILNPIYWKKRKQFKDRVYEISVGSNVFFLKEMKTNKHIHTLKGGHRPGANSFEEFKIAQYFQDHCVLEKGMFKVNWETPLASVTFPDGYQFAVYEKEGGLLSKEEDYSRLVSEMFERPAQFESEFKQVRSDLGKFLKHPLVQRYESSNFLDKVLSFFGMKNANVEFSYRDFVLVKADRLLTQAKRLLEEVVLRNGYVNNDHTGFAYKVNILVDGSIQLEIFGFDFECYQKRDNSNLDADLAVQNEIDNKDDLNFTRVWKNTELMPNVPVNIVHRALYLALVKSEGVDVDQYVDL
ncbi:hypothetical protein HOJ01_01605 [bacterium]|jgi:hypothetical protein|nr:hypothetical protein [bacterium]MBT6293483.1 hypothetical protein [bacterium]